MTAQAESIEQSGHDFVDLSWFTFQETGPAPTSAEIQRAVTGCGWHRSPSAAFVQHETL